MIGSDICVRGWLQLIRLRDSHIVTQAYWGCHEVFFHTLLRPSVPKVERC